MATIPEAERRPLQFSDLPTELRLKIWMAICHIPRNVDVWSKDIFISNKNREDAHHIPHRMFSRRRPPTILSVSREARQEALKHYILEFGATKDVGDYVITSKPRIYINPAVDTVCLPRPDTFLLSTTLNTGIHDEGKVEDFVAMLGRMKLKSLAINFWVERTTEANTHGEIASLYGDIMPTNSKFIEELILFLDSGCYAYTGRLDLNGDNEISFVDATRGELNEAVAGWSERGLTALITSSNTLDNYFSPLSTLCNSDEWQRYNSWRKRLCKVKGIWKEVPQ